MRDQRSSESKEQENVKDLVGALFEVT